MIKIGIVKLRIARQWEKFLFSTRKIDYSETSDYSNESAPTGTVPDNKSCIDLVNNDKSLKKLGEVQRKLERNSLDSKILIMTRWRIVKILWSFFCLFVLVANGFDFYQVLMHPEAYPFGAEAVSNLWYYKTQKLYLYYCVIWFLWFAAGISLCLLQYKYQKLRWIIVTHIILSVSFLGLMAIITHFG
jgi:hypothetical protein